MKSKEERRTTEHISCDEKGKQKYEEINSIV